MITDVWGMGIQSNADKLPYAGVSSKIYEVDSKSIWKYDHHRTIINTNDQAQESEKITGQRGPKSIYELSEMSKSVASPSRKISKRPSRQLEEEKARA